MSNEWMKNVVMVSGREFGDRSTFGWDPIGGTIRSVKRAGRTVGGALLKGKKTAISVVNKIPLVGKPLAAGTELMAGAIGIQLETAARIANGDRIDKAAYNTLKSRVKAVKTAAPFAAAILGGTGLGSGAEAAIATGNAASKGIAIGPDVLTAARHELGNKEAIAAFDQTYNVLVNNAPVSNKAIGSAVALTKTVMGGKANGSALNSLLSGLSSEQQKGVKAGLSLGTGKILQQNTRKLVSSDGFMTTLLAVGKGEIEKDPVTKLAAVELRHKPEIQKGFLKGLGFLAHRATPAALDAARSALTPAERAGFDIAGSIRIGQLVKPQASGESPAKKLGIYLAEGTKGMKPEVRKNILQSVKQPAMLEGVRKGLAEEKGLIEKFIDWLVGRDQFKAA